MTSLTRIVADYRRFDQPHARNELRWFALQRSLESAIENAALARRPDGKRFSHQCRIRGAVLQECRQRLLRRIAEIRACQSFEQLHEVVLSIVGDIWGVGELYAYDTALRIGAKLALAPNLVFLHAGVRSGARALGFEGSRKTLSPHELPKELRVLEPHEVEDVLCIYKAQLAGAAIAARTASGCSARQKRVIC